MRRLSPSYLKIAYNTDPDTRNEATNNGNGIKTIALPDRAHVPPSNEYHGHTYETFKGEKSGEKHIFWEIRTHMRYIWKVPFFNMTERFRYDKNSNKSEKTRN